MDWVNASTSVLSVDELTGSLCLWVKDHVVFQTKFDSEAPRSMLHVKNIHARESKQIKFESNYYREHSFVTILDGQLLVIGNNAFSQAYMLSFASPQIAMRDTPSGQIIELPDRVVIPET